MEKYGVRACYYGHLHSASHALAVEGLWDGIDYHLVSADKIDFKPYLVIK